MKSHKKRTPKPNIAFLHIPKTAGQSIHQWISNNYTNEQICPARTNEHLFQLPPVELRKYNFFSGHLDWNILKSIKIFDYVFTVLRQLTRESFPSIFISKKKPKDESLNPRTKTLSRGLKWRYYQSINISRTMIETKDFSLTIITTSTLTTLHQDRTTDSKDMAKIKD